MSIINTVNLRWIAAIFVPLACLWFAREVRSLEKLTSVLGGCEPQVSEKTRPLMLFPLLKELRAGWGNMAIPPLLQRNATGTRSLLVDVGLDKGDEFFYAIDHGFEVVGFEPNPASFQHLASKCRKVSTCEVIQDVSNVSLPLSRKEGQSYLIFAGAGAEKSELELSMAGAAGSFVKLEGNARTKKEKVPVVRLDSVIAEDVFLLKIDTQGFEHYVLKGAEKLFTNYVVRQMTFEVDPYCMSRSGLDIEMTLQMLQKYGIICFPDRNDNPQCDYLGDSAAGFKKQFFDDMSAHPRGLYAKCWEDFLCINIEKVYDGAIPSLLESS